MQFVIILEAPSLSTPICFGPFTHEAGRQWLRNLAGLDGLNYCDKDSEVLGDKLLATLLGRDAMAGGPEAGIKAYLVPLRDPDYDFNPEIDDRPR